MPVSGEIGGDAGEEVRLRGGLSEIATPAAEPVAVRADRGGAVGGASGLVCAEDVGIE